MSKMIPVISPIVDEEEMDAVIAVLKSKYLAEGKNVREFEQKFSEFADVKHAIAVTNGTAALHLTTTALGIGPGDEVITTPFTFIASTNSILYNGGVPVFADVDRDTFNMDPSNIEEKITKKTKAILPVHIFGNPTDMKALKDIADDHDLVIIEDAAQAHGAKIDGRHVGAIGTAGCFSFYATKNLISGEGGMVVTDDDELAEILVSMRNHGRPPQGGYAHPRVGYNYRMTNIVGAIGAAQMDKAIQIQAARKVNWDYIAQNCSDIDSLSFQKVLDGHSHGNYILAPIINDGSATPAEIIPKLKERGVGSRTIYALLSYEQPNLQSVQNWIFGKVVDYPDYTEISMPNAEFLARNHFEVPVVPSMSQEDRELVVEVLHELFK